jgi:hypothetical protein
MAVANDRLGNMPERLGSLAAAYASYWLSLPKIEGVPRKSALDPAAMRGFVANIVMVERHDRERFTWRLMGSAVRDLTGTELTGKDAFVFHSEEQRARALVAYNAQLDTPCGVWGVTILRSASGHEVPTEVMVLPLRGDDGALRFLANTVEPRSSLTLVGVADLMAMKFLAWPEHRFVDIGFGLPRLARPGAG